MSNLPITEPKSRFKWPGWMAAICIFGICNMIYLFIKAWLVEENDMALWGALGWIYILFDYIIKYCKNDQ